MEEKFIYVKMQDLLNEEVFHTVRLSQKQALGLGHSGYGGHATDQGGRVWKWDAQKATHVLVKKDVSHELTGHESPLKPHVENQEKEVERHVGELKQDIAEKKEEMTEKKSFSDKYVPFKQKEVENKEHVGEQKEKNVKIAEGNVGKEVVYHNPEHEQLHGAVGKISKHYTDDKSIGYHVDENHFDKYHFTKHEALNGSTGWMEKSSYDTKFGKGSFDKAKTAHNEKYENRFKPDPDKMKHIVMDGSDRKATLIGAGGKMGVKIGESYWNTDIKIHDDIGNIGKRGKTVKEHSISLQNSESSNLNYHNLRDHLVKTNPKTKEDTIKEVHNYVKSENEKYGKNIKVNDYGEDEHKGINVSHDYGQNDYKTVDLGHTKFVPDTKNGVVNVVDAKGKYDQNRRIVHEFPISHYSRLEGIKGELDKTKSHGEVWDLLNKKKFKTKHMDYDPNY